jgi:hypothetical protein
MIEERDKIADTPYRKLLNWFMASDPFPLEVDDRMAIEAFLNAEAHKREYRNWVEAYHEFNTDWEKANE